jgi:hypothetical protein
MDQGFIYTVHNFIRHFRTGGCLLARFPYLQSNGLYLNQSLGASTEATGKSLRTFVDATLPPDECGQGSPSGCDGYWPVLMVSDGSGPF